MKKVQSILIAGILSAFICDAAVADDQSSSSSGKIVYGSSEYNALLETLEKDRKNVDAKTQVVWAKAVHNPEKYIKELFDFYEGRQWRKEKKASVYPEVYVKRYVYDVADKLHSTETLTLPTYCLVASKAEIESKIVDCFKSRNRKKLEAGLDLAAKRAIRLPDGKYARKFKELPVLEPSDVPEQAEPLSGWNLFYLERSDDGNGVEYIYLDPRKYTSPEEFLDERYVDAMLELCQKLGARSIEFKGVDEKKTKLVVKGHADVEVNAGLLSLPAKLDANVEADEYTKQLRKISEKFKGSPPDQSGTDGFSSYLKKKLEAEKKAPGQLYRIWRSRTDQANAMEGKCVFYHVWNSNTRMSLSADLQAGFKFFGLPLGTFADVKVTAKKNEELSKVRAWVIEFPSTGER